MGPVIEITGDTRVTRHKILRSRETVYSPLGALLTMTSSLMTPTSSAPRQLVVSSTGIGLIKTVPKTAASWANKVLPTRRCNPLMY